jgi:hypothetical protein
LLQGTLIYIQKSFLPIVPKGIEGQKADNCKPANTEIKVAIAAGHHLFPFRTEKLSPPAPMVLRKSGRVGRCRIYSKPVFNRAWAFLLVNPVNIPEKF